MAFMKVFLCFIAFHALAEARFGFPGKKSMTGTDEKSLMMLREKVSLLQRQLQGLQKIISTKKVMIQGRVRRLEEKVATLERESWMMKRIKYQFPSLNNTQLSAGLSTKHTLPKGLLPKKTKAIMVAIKCDTWKESLYPKMSMSLKQHGNAAAGETRLDAPMNDFYYEVMVPWSDAFKDELDVKIEGASENLYTIGLVGYIA